MAQLRYLFTVGFLLAAIVVQATHIRSIEVVAKRVDCFSNTYEITLTAYLNTNTGVAFGEGLIDFGDGEIFEVPVQMPLSVNGIVYSQFSINHTFPGPGTYIIGYTEANRGESIINMAGSVSTSFYVEMEIVIEPEVCNSSPRFLVPPIDRACSGKAFYHHLGTIDPDGDSLSYELITPRQAEARDVNNYRLPNLAEFYQVSGLDYNKSNEAASGPPVLEINPSTGLITWDAPGAAGKYSLAVKIREWRFRTSDSTWNQIGYVMRDMEIVVEPCSNARPSLSEVEDICVMSGTLVDFTLEGYDFDNHPVVIEAYSELFDLTHSPATVDPAGPIVQSTLPPNDTAGISFRWQTSCEHVRQHSYQVVFKIQDRPPSGPPLVQFRTVRITVLAAPPEYESVSVNPVSKEVAIEWKDHDCETVTAYQVWRRVARYEYDEPECSAGMPKFLRYTLVGEVPSGTHSFTDDDVAIGAMYCYRLIALLGPDKTPSKLSLDTCLIPKPAEAPVITNVSVEKTDPSSGEVLIRWTPPFDIDATQYPPPYQYRVYHSTGAAGNNSFLPASELLSDTLFVDKGLNTSELSHKYLIHLFVPALSQDPVDTSSVAASVFLTPQPLFDGVRLTWEAVTPWYNYLQEHPYHLIYRSTSGDADDFVLIDSVDVNINGFVYDDKGKFQNEPLDPGASYYYKIMTRGGYGNPGIPEPLENFSQITSGVLLDITPPCTPMVTLVVEDCDALPCRPANFSNQMLFSYSDDSCQEPGLVFEVWAADGETGEFQRVSETSEYTFTHGDLDSKAVCYKVAAVDRAGNRSDFSETVCADNCPWFSLPNVLTPGNQDERNDVLMAFNIHNSETECARFVQQVDLKILNRWGKEIHFASVTPENNLVFWDGYQSNGNRVSPGVYYYEALVVFNVRNPKLRKQRVTGWIHVLAE